MKKLLKNEAFWMVMSPILGVLAIPVLYTLGALLLFGMGHLGIWINSWPWPTV